MEPSKLKSMRRLAVMAASLQKDSINECFHRKKINSRTKKDGSFVTDLDIETEKAIRNLISQNNPESWDILGEEIESSQSNSRYRWLIDPIDGTESFCRGIPTFGTIVALEDRELERSLVGAICFPALNHIYSGALESGAFKNEVPIEVSKTYKTDPKKIISAPVPLQFNLAGCEDSFIKLHKNVPGLRGYTDCWAHCLAAEGAIDGVFEPYLNRWDFAASEIIIKEAGGNLIAKKSNCDIEAYDAIMGNRSMVDYINEIIQYTTK